ncbi:MAG: DUF2961 domain-containing protein [Rikenellaceae bacterium]|nr:DUF2961 domain-containing protein [Rikenellaceae bacterium]
MKHSVLHYLLCVAACWFGAGNGYAQPVSARQNPVAKFLGGLPLLPADNRQAGQFSSHSPHQQNGDAGHFLYRDSHGDVVIFDAEGPGCVTSMWGTVLDPKGTFKFYFDGETTPRYAIGIHDFYQGKHPDFPKPFVSYDSRGYYIEESNAGNCFMPIPYAKSLRIAVEGEPNFYHILYEQFPHGTEIESFPADTPSAAGRAMIRAAMERNERASAPRSAVERPRPAAPANRPRRPMQATDTELAAWQGVDLLKVSGAGSVRQIAIEIDTLPELLRNLRLLMIWDDAAAAPSPGDSPKLAYEKTENSRLYHVQAPLGFFFGSPHAVLDLESLPLSIRRLGNGRVRLTCRFVMPYWQNARITLYNKSEQAAGRITARVMTDDTPYPQDETGYFTTVFREGMTEYGRDWLFCETPGTGWFLGAVQSCRLEHYCEGNEHFYADGNRTPQINGTGTEDYYLGCFWPNKKFNTPFAGCAADVRILGGGDPKQFLVCLPSDYTTAAVYYRFHLDMPIPFYGALDARIQHGSESQIESEYASLAYLYLRRRPALVQTDLLLVANPGSAKVHAYKASGKFRTDSLTARYEGNYLYTPIADRGNYHTNGTIAFRATVDPSNSGVRLRRRADQAFGRQRARVYVDGQYAGTWYDAQRNDILRWYDSEFEIAPELTRGKASLRIKLIVEGDSEECNFTDFEYQVLCHKR